MSNPDQGHFDGRAPASTLINATLAYLKTIDVQIDEEQLLSGLPISDGELSLEGLNRAMARIGFSLVIYTGHLPSTIKSPLCVQLTTGDFTVLVDRVGANWIVLDPMEQTVTMEISSEDLNRDFSGLYFRIAPTINLLQERHSIGALPRHWFWGRLFIRKSVLFDILASSLFSNILAVVTSLFAMQVYDRVIPGRSEATLWVLAGGVSLGICFEAWLRIARARLIDHLGKEAEIEITRDLFTKVLGMRLDRRPAQPGSIVHMVREFGSVKEFFTTAAVGVVADLPFVFVFLALIYGIASNAVWVIIIGGALTVLPGIIFQRKMARLSKEGNGGLSSSSRLLTEVSYGLEGIKLCRSESFFQRQWEEITYLNAVKTTEQRALSAFLTYWAAAMQQVTYVAAVIVGVYMVFDGELTTGAIIAVSILSTRTLAPITQIANVLSRWQNMKSALDGIDIVMTSEQTSDSRKTYIRKLRFKGHIEVRNLRFVHQGAKQMSLSIDSLTIKPGTRMALLGVNGSGKSTLLKVLSGLYQPTEGELLIDGLDIRQIDPTDVRKNIGYLPQEVRMHRGSLRENLVSDGRKYSDDHLLQALSFAGLGDFIARHPEGLDAMIVDGGEGLSIGQKQSIGLARLYLLDPSIILLDEPTASFDQNLEAEIVNRIGSWIGERTCIVATHRFPILSKLHRVGIMQNGNLVREGDRDELMTKSVSKPISKSTPVQDSGAR